MLLKKHIIGCVSLLLLLFWRQTADSCGWYPASEEYRFCVFNAKLANEPELDPMVFTTDKFLYNFTNDEINDSVYRCNVGEWAAYTKNKVPRKDIYYILYNFDPLKYLNYQGTLVETNSFIKYLNEHDKEAFNYVTYAKRCEQVINNSDPWEDNFGFVIDEDAAERLIQEGEIFYADTKSDFLKLHVAYQLERLFFYYDKPVLGLGDDKEKIYKQKIEKSRVSSWIKNSAYYYYSIGNFDSLCGYNTQAECDYALSKAFDKSPDKRFRCVQLFSRKMKGALRLAKNNHEKAVLNVMYQLQNTGIAITGLQNIYTLDPVSSYLPFLLVREVNKLEDWVVTDRITGMGSASNGIRTDIPEKEREYWVRNSYAFARGTKDMQYLDILIGFVNHVCTEGKQSNTALYNLMAAHLYIIKGDTVNALAELEKADKAPMNEAVRKQVAVSELMLKVVRNPKLDNETENQLMQLAKTKRPKFEADDYFDGSGVPEPPVEDQLILFAGRTLMQKGNFAKGLLLLANTQCMLGMIGEIDITKNLYTVLSEQASPKEYEELLALIDKKDKTPFEKFLTSTRINDYPMDGYGWDTNSQKNPIYNRPINRYKVLDYEANYYMNRDSLDLAYKALSQIPDWYWNRDPYNDFKDDNPFRVTYLAVDHDDPRHGEVRWNKRNIVKRIIALKKEVIANPQKRAVDYRLLGNVYYNTSRHGKYWIMNRIWRSYADVWQDNDKMSEQFKQMYFGCSLAKKYYLLGATQSGGSFDNTGWCYYMAGVCQKHYDRYVWHRDHVNDWRDDEPVIKYKYFYSFFMKPFRHEIDKRMDNNDTTECTFYNDFLATAVNK
jgi:hypothetical protein